MARALPLGRKKTIPVGGMETRYFSVLAKTVPAKPGRKKTIPVGGMETCGVGITPTSSVAPGRKKTIPVGGMETRRQAYHSRQVFGMVRRKKTIPVGGMETGSPPPLSRYKRPALQGRKKTIPVGGMETANNIIASAAQRACKVEKRQSR